jgi:formate--tetrahydrofolate ligase
VKQFNVPVIVSVNHFTTDTDKEFEEVKKYCSALDVDAVLSTHWKDGSEGIKNLANKVVDICQSNNKKFNFLYEESMSLWDKVDSIAKNIYGASEIVADKNIRDQFKSFEEAGFGKFPICMAKTQYSFSTDPNLKGAPNGHVVAIKEIRLAAGAEFLVVEAGEIMTMPGLPKTPAANSIRLNKDNEILGLF